MKKEPTKAEVCDGLRKLAFGNVADAVKLITAEDTSALNLKRLNLINVAEIKFSKNGVAEVKFFDRIKALEKLGEFVNDNDANTESSFFTALLNSASGEEKDGI